LIKDRDALLTFYDFPAEPPLLDPMMDQCAKEIIGRWSDKLESVDVYARSHCHTALIYARWDD